MNRLRLRPMTRRKFLRLAGAAVLTGGAGAGAYGYFVEPHWVAVVRRDLPIDRLPDSLVGCTLVQISDLHVGPVVDDDYMKSALKRVSELDADILCFTGDFVTYRNGGEIDQAARVLESLKPARIATLGIFGNHDYGPHWSDPRIAEKLSRRVTDLGMEILRNESKDVRGLQVVGLDDYWGPGYDPKRVMPTIDHEAAAIVLCHNPDVADEPVWSDYQGWILAGHTHGGQCKPPFFRPPLLPVSNTRYSAGEIDLADGRKLYINHGLGYLKRIRINVRPEITVFRLTRAG